MEQAPLISIIMPVYNAGVLLHTAVESVLCQSFADFELLLVDDGSTDGSAALAHELAKKDGRIRVLEQPNAGICAARNLGLQHCRGQWFTFCDDDDTMLPHALEILLVLAKSTGADVVRGGYRLLRANAAGTAVELPHPPGQAIIIHKPAGQGYLQFLQQSGPQFVWNAMYCTNRLGHLRFDETCRKGLEDFAFNAAVFQQADSAAYTPQIVYEHLERQGSTSACGNPAAVQVRLQYLPRWVQAEYTAARAWCPPQQLPKVWSARQAEFVTFVMHQLRDGRLPPKAKAAAWRSLQQALAACPHSRLDFWYALRHNKKTGCRTVFVPYPPAGAVCLPAKPGGETATMKTILVTGAAGYIGRHVVKKALDMGYRVIASDFAFKGVDERAEFCDVPIFSGDKNIYAALGKPDVCIHMAWRDGFRHNASSHMKDLSSHVTFLNNMAAGGLSDLTVMGTMHEVGYWEGAIEDDTPCNPLSQYGIAKNALRQSMMLSLQGSSCNLHWLRAYYITGDEAHGSSIFAKIAQAELDGKTTFPFTSGQNKYDFIDLDELATMIVAASVQNKVNGIINVCTGQPRTLADRVEQFLRDKNYKIKLDYGVFPDRPYDSPGVWGDPTKINAILKDAGLA